MPLYDILNEFQKGHSHIAVVCKDLNAKKESTLENNEGEKLKFKGKKLRGKSHSKTCKRKMKPISGAVCSMLYHLVFDDRAGIISSHCSRINKLLFS